MIAYEIIVNHKRDQRPQRELVTPGDSNYKDTVFQRQFRACQYEAGQRVKIRKGHTRGVIEEVLTDINHINWKGNKPMFLRVKFDNGQTLCVNPNEVKRSK